MEKKVYVFKGLDGFTSYEVSANGRRSKDQLPLGSWSLQTACQDNGGKPAFWHRDSLINVPMSIEDIDQNGCVTTDYVCRFVDRVVSVVNSTAYASYCDVSPTVGPKYANRLCTCVCDVIADILENSGLCVVAKVCEEELSNPKDDRYLKSWKHVTCAVDIAGMVLSFVIHPLYNVMWKYSVGRKPGIVYPAYAFTVYGEKGTEPQAVAHLQQAKWERDEEGKVQVSVCTKRERRVPTEVRFSRQHGPSGEKRTWQKRAWVDISEEEAMALNPETVSRIVEKNGDGPVSGMKLE